MSEPRALIGIFAILFTFLVVAFVLWLFYRALRALFRLLWGAVTTGRDRVDLLFGAGVATILFPQAPRALVAFIAYFFLGVGEALRSLTGQGFRMVAEMCTQEGGNCPTAALAISDQLAAALGVILHRVLSAEFPLVSVILFCATWALVASASASLRTTGQVALPFAMSGPSATAWRSLALTAVGLVGVYLSVTAVMAVPLLDEANRTSASQFTGAGLKADLDQVQPVQIENGQIVRRVFPPINPVAPPVDVAVGQGAPPAGDSQAPAAIVPPETPAPGTDAVPDTVPQQAEAAPVAGPAPQAAASPPAPIAAAPSQDLRGVMESEYERLVQTYAAQEESAHRSALAYRQAALSAFIANNDGRLGERERAQHYNELYTWYRVQVGALSRQLGECASQVSRYAVMARQLPRFLAPLDPQLNAGSLGRAEIEAIGAANQAQLACAEARPPETAMPARKAYGDSLGAVGLMARWLLGTESREVALIVGLVGFGILGALVSWLAARKEGDSIEYGDVAAVLLRGFGAAVVVFLASYGGLAAIAQNGQQPEPSPYVVFFLCLVAAVFSADVWRWARTHLPGGSPRGGAKA